MKTKLKAQAVLALSIQVAFSAGALANPTGAQVVAGQVGFAQPNAATLAITNSPGSIINWQGFSIGQGEITRFIQQSASSAVLNRVVGANLSQIYGTLQSNGRVFLVNPAGIVVGAGGIIDTAGFVASTLPMLDSDFLAGKLAFQAGADSGSIANRGSIRTGYGGRVALIAPDVENSGLIQTPGGSILLAAGRKVSIASLDLDGVQFEVQAPADTVLNLGRLIADGGAVGVFAGTLTHSGTIRAGSLVRNEAGEIVLRAAGDVRLEAGSTTSANGNAGGSVTIESLGATARVAGSVSATGSGGAGGRIEVLGERVSLAGAARLDASGATAGGTILAGGDYQGANPSIRNSQDTYVGPDARLRADATAEGDGGRIVVWSDGNTRFFGSLSAKGAPAGGNGGFAEVSGKGDLLFVGGADLGAPKGAAGTLLLDPLDLFVDAHGGINALIIDEDTDFPKQAVTVSPATLTAIAANVILFASRDLRFNSAVALTGAGQGLSAQAGRNLEMAAGITTSGGAVSLTAAGTYVNPEGATEGGNLVTYASSPIATAGGAVTLTAKDISAGSINIDAGAGAVTASASAGSVHLGSVTSSGSIAMTSTGASSISTASLTSTGAVTLTANDGSISTGSIATGGGSLTARANDGSFYASGTIDTRSGGAATGGAVSINATDTDPYYGSAYINTRSILAGDANVTLSGESISTASQPIATTGNVNLSAATGDSSANASISAKVNDAASVTANASHSGTRSASVNLSSDTTLNATSVSATATNCSALYSCPSATVTLSGTNGVTVGTVTATASRTHSNESSYGPTYDDPKFENIGETVSITASNGSITGQSASSLITAADVTLQTGLASGGGIHGTSPLKVDVERRFYFRPNGDFDVQLTGTGPNLLDMQFGVAHTGATWTGTLAKSGQIALTASADDATVTVSSFNVTGGFDQRVFNTSPAISLYVPNGALALGTVSVPKGDQTGTASPASRYFCAVYGSSYCPPSITIEPLSVAFRSIGDLSVSETSYTREAGGTVGKSTTFRSYEGSVTLGTVSASLDQVSVNASTGVTISNSLTTGGYTSIDTDSGDVSIAGSLTSAGGAELTTGNGNVLINSIDGGTGSVSIDAYGSTSVVGAIADNTGLEITTGGSVSIYANTIGSNAIGGSPAANPLDVAASTVSLSSGATGSSIGFAERPVIANTSNLTIDASANFNVDTGPVDLTNLTVTASPSAVGAGGLAQVTSNLTTSAFASDGADFTLDGYTAPAAQFDGGTLSFTATGGNLTLGNIDFSASGGSLAVRTNAYGTGNVTQTVGSAIDLGTGIFSINADNAVSLEAVNAGGMNVSYSNYAYSSGGCAYYYVCGVASFTANQPLTDAAFAAGTGGGGTWSVTSRGAITTGDLRVGGANFNAVYSGDISTGAIGTAGAPASNVSLSTGSSGYGTGGNISTGAIEADSLSANIFNESGHSIAVGGPINAANTGAGSVSLNASWYGPVSVAGDINASSVTITGSGSITSGNINAAAPDPSDITLHSYSSGTTVATGALDAGSISVGAGWYYHPASITVAGAIGSHSPGTSANIRAGAITVQGPVTMDPVSAATVSLDSDSTVLLGAAGMGDAITGGDGTSIYMRAGNTDTATPFRFTTLEAGPTGQVTVDAPAGILQVAASASGGGIDAGTVSLSATSAGSAIASSASPLTLRGATGLTIDAGGSVDLALAGIGTGSTPELTDLTITRSDNTAAFSLTGFNPAQSVSIVNDTATTGGVTLEVLSSNPLNLAYRNTDGTYGNVAATGAGISTGGGSLTLSATQDIINSALLGIHTAGGWVNMNAGGVLSTGAIDSTGIEPPDVPIGGSVSLSAGSSIDVDGTVNAGPAGISTSAPNVSGIGTLSASSVDVTASDGDIGTVDIALAISSPTANLSAYGAGGNVYAMLAGTTDLTLRADNGSAIVSDTALDSVSFETRGTGAGALGLSAPGQSYVFARPAADAFGAAITDTFQVVSVGGASPASATFRALDGDLLVVGDMSGAGAIGSANLTLGASTGSLKLQGTITDPLALENANQTFSASQDVLIDGTVTLSASNDQSISAARDLSITGNVTLSAAATDSQTLNAGRDLAVLAQGGRVDITSAGSQTLNASGNLTLQGGSAADEAVEVQAGGNQTIQTYYWGTGSISLLAGTADGTSVTVTKTGSGSQRVSAAGDLTLQAGGSGTTGAQVTIQSGGSSQTIYANGTIAINAGDGTDAWAAIRSSAGTQKVGDSYNYYGRQTDTVTLQGGAGTNAHASIEASGDQRVEADFNVNVLGGSGSGAWAKIEKLPVSDEQRVGFYRPDCYYWCSNSTVDNVTVGAGSGFGSYAEISTLGVQRVSPVSSLTVQGGAGEGAYGRISNDAATQYIGNSYDGSASTNILGGAGLGAHATIETFGSQIVDLGNTTLTAGTGNASDALINALDGTQTLSVGNLTLTGGGSAGADTAVARVFAAGDQTIHGSLIALTGGVGPESIARIDTLGSQTIQSSGLSLAGGTGADAGAQVESATSQTLWFGNVSITGGSGANTAAYILAGTTQSFNNLYSLTLTGGSGAGSGASASGDSQWISSSGNVSLTGGTGSAGSHSEALLLNRTGDQSVTASGSLSLKGGGTDFGGAFLRNAGSGTQTVSANNGITVDTDFTGVTANSPARIENLAATLQTLSASNGGIQVSAAAAGAAITSAGGQTSNSRWVDVHTHGAATAEISSPADQWIHTTTGAGSPAAAGLRIAALGSGTAKIEAGTHQQLEIAYPEMMRVTGDSHSANGKIVVGDAAATGSSLLKAASQDIFAQSVTVHGGSGDDSLSKIDVAGDQNFSTLLGGVTVTGGTGANALATIDPAVQTLLANGTVGVAGGSGTGAAAEIASTGTQTLITTLGDVSVAGGAGADATATIATSGASQTIAGAVDVTLLGGGGTSATADISSAGGQQVLAYTGDVALTGGAGDFASAMIFTSGPTQAVGAGGDIFLTAGTGLEADALLVVGGMSGAGTTIFGCGTGACAVPGLLSSPFANGTADAGLFRAPTATPPSSPLADIIDLLFPEVIAGPPFAPDDALTDLLVLYRDTYSGFVGEGEPVTEEEDIRGRLKLCR